MILMTNNDTNIALFSIAGVKRLIGRKWEEPTVQQDIAQWPFRVINEGGRPKIAVTHKGTERTFYPEEISSMVLSYMKTTAEKYLSKTVRNAVVTVPAYFTDSQRQATKDAAAIAGLNVLRIINEPTAAALAYGLGEQQEDERTVLIFDFGGGTFDVSILVIEEGIFEVRSTAGDTHLGGEDLDVALAIHFAEEFNTQHRIDVKGDKDAMSRLRRASERAKCALSAVTETRVELYSLHRDVDFRTTITRARFEQVCGDLLRNTLEPVRRALNDAKMTVKNINEIVLVGGSTRIPMVQELLKEFFGGQEPAQNVNPDEAVAIGAAVQAAVLGGDPSETVTDLVLLDVTPLSLGTTVRGEIMSVIIPRNTSIPSEHTSSYTTIYDYQTEVDVEVLEGERRMSTDNHLLGKFTLSGIRSAPAGVPKIKVTFSLDADGILHASAVEERSNVSNQITIINDKGRLSPEEIARLVREAERFKQEDELKYEASEARNDLEKYCYMLQNGLRENSTLSSSIHQTITSKCEETLRWIRDNPNASVDDYKRKRRDLELLRDLVFMEL